MAGGLSRRGHSEGGDAIQERPGLKTRPYKSRLSDPFS
jgi:hypothetical protein